MSHPWVLVRTWPGHQYYFRMTGLRDYKVRVAQVGLMRLPNVTSQGFPPRTRRHVRARDICVQWWAIVIVLGMRDMHQVSAGISQGGNMALRLSLLCHGP